ncbi:MAG: TolC family protein [Planctomycetia bacterium]|nr:TolC family protein [Planctomycetia bacterium]
MSRWFFALILGFCTSVMAQETGSAPSTLTLSALEQMALANHPTIQAYEQKIQAGNGYWLQAGLGPNPEIGYHAEEMSGEGAGKQGISISQEFLGGSQLYHAQTLEAQRIETAKQELEIARLRIITDVRIAAYEYLAIQNKLLNLRKIYASDAELASRLEKSYRNGNTTKLDWVNSRISARKAEQQYMNAQNDLNAAWGRLACLVGNPELEPCLVRANLEQIPEQKTWEYYAQVLLSTSPEIARAQAKIEEARKKVNYENSRNSTNFSLSGAVAYNTESEMVQGNVGISMPLRVRDRNQGNISAACSESIQAQKDYERVTLNIQHRLADVYAEYANASKDLELYRDSLLPEAKEALSLARTAYENQETSMIDLISAQRMYLETNIEYYDALCVYWTSLTVLEGKLLTGGLEDSSL